MANWDDFARELGAWGSEGRTATAWWRDDDATTVTPALERLLGISEETGVAVGLAVIPSQADEDLRQRLSAHRGAAVIQHGFGHANHAPDDSRQEEYGPHRPREVMLAELADGWRRTARFDHALPVLVPPWNRFDRALLPELPGVGLRGVSSLGPRDAAEPAAGVSETNVHVDIMDWQGGGFIGEDAALDQVVDHLAARRRGEADAREPTGLMTHHAYHDEACWTFLRTLLTAVRDHPAGRWTGTREAFWP